MRLFAPRLRISPALRRRSSAAFHSRSLRAIDPLWSFGDTQRRVLASVAGKGGKNRRRGKGDGSLDKRELIFKEPGQEYAQVVRCCVSACLCMRTCASVCVRAWARDRFARVSHAPAQVRMLGNGRLEASCFDGTKRLCHIRGKMRKKVWINSGDIVLIGLRDFQADKADVILKYTADEARQLKVCVE